MRNNNGQEAVEFVLIVVLVFFAGLFTFLIFGNQLSSFFKAESSVVQSSEHKSDVLTANTPTKYDPDYKTDITTGKNIIGGYEVDVKEDGSISFNVKGQEVYLSKAVIDLQNTVLKTSGASGAESLIKEIGYLIQKHKPDYPDSDVPVNLMFGSGERLAMGSTYSKDADVNTTLVQVDNHCIIYQKDHVCNGANCDYKGVYRIDGTIDENMVFSGKVTSDVDKFGTTKGAYTANVDTSGAVKLTSGYYNHYDNNYPVNPLVFNWNMEFDNPSNQFTLNN